MRHGIYAVWDERIQQHMPITPISIQDHINTLPGMDQDIIQHIRFPEDEGRTLAMKMTRGEIIAACDGSVKNKQGSYGFIITDKDRTSIIQGYGKVHKVSGEHTSQRAEL